MSASQITRSLPNGPYLGAVNANNPSAANPFLTESALSSGNLLDDTGIYRGSGQLSSGTTVDLNGFSLAFQGTGGTINFSPGGDLAGTSSTASFQRVNASSGVSNGFKFNGFGDHGFYLLTSQNTAMMVTGQETVRFHRDVFFRAISNTQAVPVANLDFIGESDLQADSSLLLRNLSGNHLMNVRNNGFTALNTNLPPTNVLTVESGAVNGQGIALVDSTSIVATLFYTTSAGSGGQLSLRDSGGNERVVIQGGSTNGVSVFGQNSGSHRVGIGTSLTPSATLHVRGPQVLSESSSSNHLFTIRGTGNSGILAIEGNNTGDAFMRWTQSGTVRFVSGYDTSADRFLITAGNAFNANGMSMSTSNTFGFGGAPVNSKLEVHNGDAEVVGSANGLILTAPDSTRWRITMTNSGAITSTQI